jgi:hypothetical protein
VRVQLPCRRGAFEHRGELWTTDPGHHPGRAHGAGPDPDLDDVGAGLDEIAHAFGGDDIAGDDRHLDARGPHGPQRIDHPFLVAVGGVQHEHVDAGLDEPAGPRGDVAVDPGGGRHPQPAARVQRRPVERGPQRAAPGQQPDQPPVGVDRRGQPVVHLAEPFEGGRRGHPLRDRHDLPRHDPGDLGEAVDPVEVGVGDHPDRSALLVEHHCRAMGALGQQPEGVGDRRGRRQGDGSVVHQVAALDEGDDIGDDVVRDVLGDDDQPPPAGHRLGHPPPRHGGHVRHDDGDRRARPVLRGQVDVHPGGHRAAAGHHEDVVVGQVPVRRHAVEEAHPDNLDRAQAPARGSGHRAACRGTRTS